MGRRPADKTITDCDAPSILNRRAPAPNMMHQSVTATPDVCPRILRGAATWASNAEVPTVPHPHAAPCLLEALQKNNLDALMAALTDHPDSATLPFMEHNMEPPVCAAV